MLIDPETNRVHAGGTAIRRPVCDRGVPRRLVDVVQRTYEIVGDPLGKVIHGQVPANVDWTFPLTEDARPHLESLRRECSLAACVSGNDTSRRTGQTGQVVSDRRTESSLNRGLDRPAVAGYG